jgi:flavin reductase (DIM6/NTAB) family NADH-FMN oxidoreductase RutF
VDDALNADSFREVLAAWPSGVAVVTTHVDGLCYGLTVSSFTSVSIDPPLVLVCIAHENRLPEMVARSGGFAVSVLGAEQEGASRYFARAGRRPTAEFTEIDGEWLVAGQPAVRGALATLVCGLHAAHEAGDHIVLIGRVLECASRQGEPLVYQRRGYRRLT